MPEDTNMGKLAYNTFRECGDGADVHSGIVLPDWKELSTVEQDVWNNVGRALKENMMALLPDVLDIVAKYL